LCDFQRKIRRRKKPVWFGDFADDKEVKKEIQYGYSNIPNTAESQQRKRQILPKEPLVFLRRWEGPANVQVEGSATFEKPKRKTKEGSTSRFTIDLNSLKKEDGAFCGNYDEDTRSDSNSLVHNPSPAGWTVRDDQDVEPVFGGNTKYNITSAPPPSRKPSSNKQ